MSLNTSTRPMTYSLYQGSHLVGFNAPSKAKGLATWGYVCDTYTEAKPLQADRLIVNKETEGLSWGTVTAQFTEPLAATTASGTDLSISRHIQRWENGQWTTLPAKATLRVGERVRQVVTLKAVRDMDFVAVKLSHLPILKCGTRFLAMSGTRHAAVTALCAMPPSPAFSTICQRGR